MVVVDGIIVELDTEVVVVGTAEVVLVSPDVVVVLDGTEVVVVVGGTVVLAVCILIVAVTFSSCAGLDKRVVISIIHSPDVAPFWIVSGTNMNLPTLNAFLRLLRLTP